MNRALRNAVGTVGASLFLAAGIAGGTIRAAGGTTPPNELAAIHAMVDASVLQDVQTNYSLPATRANCVAGGAPSDGRVPIHCTLYGNHGWRALGRGVLLGWAQVGMVYAPDTASPPWTHYKASRGGA